jgi:NAD(P)-dependent dehydrogenase (short-subunit alcohol dehydrogenase family)
MIILTGASGGIGKEIVNQLTKIDHVLGLYNTSLPENTENDKVRYVKLDIEKPDKIEAFVDEWKAKLCRVTLIHCAASKVDGLVANYSLSDWDHVMGVNLRGNFLLAKALIPHMISDRWGRFVHISSRGGMEGNPGTIAYSTSKAGLVGMSRVLAKEYARFNITSNILVLGAFETGMYLKLPDELKREILDRIPSRSLGNVSNIVNAIDFLIKSEYVNASVINIDGGM